jgi:hypothetical protein
MKTRLAIAMAGFAVTSLFFIDLCNFIFACGCTSLWAGAEAHCNVHQSVRLHCPICTLGPGGYAIVYGLIALPQIAVALLLRRGRWMLRFAIVLLLFPVLGTAVMSVTGWLSGYPVNRVVFRSKLY